MRVSSVRVQRTPTSKWEEAIFITDEWSTLVDMKGKVIHQTVYDIKITSKLSVDFKKDE